MVIGIATDSARARSALTAEVIASLTVANPPT